MYANVEDTQISTWFERDRAHVCFSYVHNDQVIVEWWDEAVNEAVEDGFLNPKDWHASAFSYATDHGLLEPGAVPASIKPPVIVCVASHPDLGVYCGWKQDGSPIWSSEVDAQQAENGAYGFSSYADAMRLLEEDGVDNGVSTEVPADITRSGLSKPDRVSFAVCEGHGIHTGRENLPSPS